MDIVSEYQDLKISIWVSQKISMDIKSIHQYCFRISRFQVMINIYLDIHYI